MSRGTRVFMCVNNNIMLVMKEAHAVIATYSLSLQSQVPESSIFSYITVRMYTHHNVYNYVWGFASYSLIYIHVLCECMA